MPLDSRIDKTLGIPPIQSCRNMLPRRPDRRPCRRRGKRGETIVEVETDKTTVEVPALSDGTIVEILAEKGKELKVGEPLCVIQSDTPLELPSGSAVAGESVHPLDKRNNGSTPTCA